MPIDPDLRDLITDFKKAVENRQVEMEQRITAGITASEGRLRADIIRVEGRVETVAKEVGELSKVVAGHTSDLEHGRKKMDQIEGRVAYVEKEVAQQADIPERVDELEEKTANQALTIAKSVGYVVGGGTVGAGLMRFLLH